jgi:acetylornithine deacetylase
MWTHPPFDPVIKDGWIYGRGGGDMKAGGAANLFALDALARIGLAPAAPVTVQFVVEEESTGNGAIMAHIRGYEADAVLIPEPEEEMLVRACVGVLWFTVEVRGVPVHVREMGEGANAIDAAFRVRESLRELEAAWNERKAGRPHFDDVDHPINLNVGRIEGGDWASSVPSWCRLHCRVSIFPGVTAEEAAKEIEAHVAKFAQGDPFLSNNPPEVTFNGFFAEGYVQEEGSEAEAVLAAAHEAATGGPLESFMTPGYLDARVFALYDRMPTLCYGPKSKGIHGVDERCEIESLKRVTVAMALFIAEWCGVEEIG